MNEIRRKELEAIVDKLVKLYYELDHLGGEEGDAYENLPRELRQTERAEMMIEAEDNIRNACDEIEQVLICLENAKNC